VTEKGLCYPCNAECEQCDGPSHINCTRCKNRKIYVDDLVAQSDNDEQLLAELLTNYSVTANDTVQNALWAQNN